MVLSVTEKLFSKAVRTFCYSELWKKQIGRLLKIKLSGKDKIHPGTVINSGKNGVVPHIFSESLQLWIIYTTFEHFPRIPLQIFTKYQKKTEILFIGVLVLFFFLNTSTTSWWEAFHHLFFFPLSPVTLSPPKTYLLPSQTTFAILCT